MRMIQLPAFLVVVAGICAGCQQSPAPKLPWNRVEAGKARPKSVCQVIKASVESGTLDAKTGNLIAYWLLREPGTEGAAGLPKEEPLIFSGDYGILMIGPSAEGDRSARFYLYDNKAKIIYATVSLNAFLEQVGRLPAKAKVFQLEKCTVPFDYEMPKLWLELLAGIMDQGQRTGADQDETNQFSPCTCTTSGLKFPDGFKY